MNKPSVPLHELPPETRKKLGLRTRITQFSKDDVRTWAIKVLNVVADLKQDQRRRILEHALTVNKK